MLGIALRHTPASKHSCVHISQLHTIGDHGDSVYRMDEMVGCFQYSVAVLIAWCGCGKEIFLSCQRLEGELQMCCVFHHFVVNAVAEIVGVARGSSVVC